MSFTPEHNDFASLRALLEQPPSPEVWSEVVRLFEEGRWSLSHDDEEGDAQVALEYAQAHLAAWPASMRRLEVDGATPSSLWRLADDIRWQLQSSDEPASLQYIEWPSQWQMFCVSIDEHNERVLVPRGHHPMCNGQVVLRFPSMCFEHHHAWCDALFTRFSGPTNQVRSLLLFSGFEHVPESLYGLHSLQHLAIHDDRLLSLSSRISELSQLKSLSLRASHLISLPNKIRELQALRSFSLVTHSLVEFPKAFGQLRQLTSFSLELEELHFHHWDHEKCHTVTPRLVQQLDEVIGILAAIPHLETLRLAGAFREDGLEECDIPENIGELEMLRELDLTDFDVAWLPASVGELVYLESICLSRYGYDAVKSQLEAYFPDGRFLQDTERSSGVFQTGRKR